MDHFRGDNSPSPRKPRSTRRNTMNTLDQFQHSSPSSNQSPSSYLKKSMPKPMSKKDLFDHVNVDPLLFRVPFGEEGTQSTQETSDSRNAPIKPPIRKSSIDYPETEPARRNRSVDAKSRVHFNRKRIDRNRSELGRHKSRLMKRSVSVEEILAVVATTEIPDTSDKVNYQWRSCDEFNGAGVGAAAARDIDRSFQGSTGSGSRASSTRESHERTRERTRGRSSDTAASRQKNGRNGRASSRSPSVYNRRGILVDVEESPAKKKKPIVLGKESRRNGRNRRGSTQ